MTRDGGKSTRRSTHCQSERPTAPNVRQLVFSLPYSDNWRREYGV